MKAEYIGDKNNFAIRYVCDFTQNDDKYKFAYCHLVLRGQIIGDKNELCYLNSWRIRLQNIKEQIKNNFDSISHAEFENSTDKELFELIFKANQLEEEYNIDYYYLPKLESKIWSSCHISIDETTDDYLITMTGYNDKIKFLWKINDELYSIIAERNYVIEILEKALEIIERDYYL